MRVDMHTHSLFSDGTETPTQVMQAAAEAGLDGLALTDHDTTQGWEEARVAAQELGMLFIPGSEITAQAGATSVHMLSYLHDPQHPLMRTLNETAQSVRYERAQMIYERLSADFPISWQMVTERVGPDSTIGRPHLADALVAAGVVVDRSEAFHKYLHRRSKYYVSQAHPHPREAIAAITAAGGVPVIAHAMAGARGSTLNLEALEELVEFGLAGVEVWHRDNTDTGRELLLDLAQRHDLIITGASDYHGAAGKPNVLGENTTAWEHVERILAAGSGTAAYNFVS